MTSIYFSDFFDVDPAALEERDAFNVSLINDLPVFVDPFLLFNSDEEELQSLHEEIIRYMRFLKEVATSGPVPKPLVDAWFTFPEVKQNWLGFSITGNSGRGLGKDFANALCKNLKSVFHDFGEETVTRGSHIEKLCLVRDGVGRDNISDFTTNLIKSYLATYTQEIAQSLLPKNRRRIVSLTKTSFNYQTQSWRSDRFELPFIDGDFVLLTPKRILTKDEAWINRPELLDRYVDIADSLPDGQLRAQLNEYLRRVLPDDPEATRKDIREAIAKAVERFPGALDYYVREKEDTGDRAAAFASQQVREVEQIFIQQIRELVSSFLEPSGFYEIPTNTFEDARQRLLFLKRVIEEQGGYRLFYIKGKPVQREADLQILYRLVWFASISDVTREANDGRGPADFKISRGFADKTIVELKLAKNTQLERNLQKQAELYSRASQATHPPLKGILYFSVGEFERVQEILHRLGLSDSPYIVLIDAMADNKPSGSKA